MVLFKTTFEICKDTSILATYIFGSLAKEDTCALIVEN